MIKKLQIKIVLVVLGTLFIVFAAVLLVLNISVAQTSARRADHLMTTIIENDGFFPRHRGDPSETVRVRIIPRSHADTEMIRSGRFFYVRTDFDGNITEENLQLMFNFDDAEVYVTTVMGTGRATGNINNFRFMTEEKPYGHMIVFTERSMEMYLISQLNRLSLWVAGIVCLILFLLSVFLSKWIVAPVKNTFEKQRRFISDASHELKTPLTIISANADFLANEISDNQRISHIKLQSGRMSGLIHDMLTLAKADEGQTDVVRGRFDLSAAILNTALEFESPAFEEGKIYSYDIAENIEYVGDEKQIKQLAAILIDNAIRYSAASGKIEVALHAENNHRRLSVYNTGSGVPDNEREKIFGRFYRTDESRSRETGGYGIGLSIAKAIAESHKGKISVSGEFMKWIKFDVIL